MRVDQLTSAFDGESKAQLFGRNVDVYTNAPLVGFLYGRTAEQDDTKNPETNQVLFPEVLHIPFLFSSYQTLTEVHPSLMDMVLMKVTVHLHLLHFYYLLPF